MEATLTQEIVTISPFEKTKEELIEFVSGYTNLVVTDETFEEAKKARLSLRDMRYKIQETEKANTNKLNELKTINWDRSKELLAEITPTEEKIDSGIKAIEQRKAAIKAEKERIEREKVEAEIKAEQERLAQIERDRVAKIEADQKAEAERLAALQKEIEAAQKLERERLDKIKAEQERIDREFRIEQAKVLKEQQEKEARIKAEQEAINRQKREMEEARQREANEKIRQAELEHARKEAAENARIQAEAKAKREAEEKIEAERKVKEEIARQEALKPDKEKLKSYSMAIFAVGLPIVQSKEAKQIIGGITIKVNELIKFIDTEINKL